MYPDLYFSVCEENNLRKGLFHVPKDMVSHDGYVTWVMPECVESFSRKSPALYSDDELIVIHDYSFSSLITVLQIVKNSECKLKKNRQTEIEIVQVFPAKDWNASFAIPMTYRPHTVLSKEHLVAPVRSDKNLYQRILKKRYGEKPTVTRAIRKQTIVLQQGCNNFRDLVAEEKKKYKASLKVYQALLKTSRNAVVQSCEKEMSKVLPNAPDFEITHIVGCLGEALFESYLRRHPNYKSISKGKVKQGKDVKNKTKSHASVDLAKEALHKYRKEIVGAGKAAKLLGVDRTRIHQYATAGRLGTRVDGKYLFTIDELEAFEANPSGKHLEE